MILDTGSGYTRPCYTLKLKKMKTRFFQLILVLSTFLPLRALQAQSREGQDLLNRYLAIKNALVSGQVSQAATESAAFSRELGKFQPANLDAKGQENLKTYKATLLMSSSAMATTSSLSVQREQFASFSDAMINLANLVKLGNSPVYVDYCPMKKSYWLSEEKAIRNPYYGNSMLTCGKITDTLN